MAWGVSWGTRLGCLFPASKNLPSSEAGPAQTGPTPWTRPVTHMRRVPALGWAHSYFKAPWKVLKQGLTSWGVLRILSESPPRQRQRAVMLPEARASLLLPSRPCGGVNTCAQAGPGTVRG